MTTPASYTTLLHRFYGSGSWSLVFLIENQCYISFSSATSDETAGVEELSKLGGSLEGKLGKQSLTEYSDFRELHRRSDLVEILDVSMWVSLYVKKIACFDKIKQTMLDSKLFAVIWEHDRILKFVGLVVVDVYGLENECACTK
ncbi:hypothetical protein Tco_0642725 [Tanacetum coccineum]